MTAIAFDTTDCTAAYGVPRMPFRDGSASDDEDLVAAAQACVNGWSLTDPLRERICQAYLDLQAKADMLVRQLVIQQGLGEKALKDLGIERVFHAATRCARDTWEQNSTSWEQLYRNERSICDDAVTRILKAEDAVEEAEALRDDAVEELGKLAAENRVLMNALKRITDTETVVIDVEGS